MQQTRIAILGGGYGGVHAAKVLLKELKKHPEVVITLYDRNPYHTLMTELHEVAGGRAEPESVRVPFKKIFGQKRIQVVIDDIKNVDFEAKTLKGSDQAYSYDYLLLGPGAEPAFFGVKGAQENSFTLWSHDDSVKIRRHIRDQFMKASRMKDREARRHELSFVVAGAGFTGVEMLGELLEWKYELCEEFAVALEDVSVHLVEAMTDILPILTKKLRTKAMNYIEKKGGQIHLNSPIEEVTATDLSIKGGKKIKSKTIIWTCGVKGSDFINELNMDQGKTSTVENNPSPFTQEETNQRYNIQKKGRVMVNDYMQGLEHDEVYFLGDVVWYSEKNRTLPQIVETALQTAGCAAKNLAAALKGTPLKPFKSNYHGFMISIGSRFAVADLMGVLMSGFIAMGFKHLVNLHYLFEVGGFSLCWDYLNHHFLKIPHKRCMVGGQLKAKTPSYWLLPLRVLLGIMVLSAGIGKINEGYLDPSKGVNLPGIKLTGRQVEASRQAPLQGRTLLESDSTTAASEPWEEGAESQETDTTSASTEWEEEAGSLDTESAATEWESVSEAPSIGSEEKNLLQHLQSFLGIFERYPLMESFFLYDWFAQWLATMPWLAFLLQASVAIAQVLIGLALMSGLFTWLASVAWIGLSAMFIVSGWGDPILLWHIAASVAMMGGAGRVLGLDAWVMPFMKKWWNKTALAQNTHFYVDRIPPPQQSPQ